MKKNMGKTDKTIRLVIALVAAILYFGGLVPAIFGLILLVVAVIFVTTSAISFCPLYAIFGIQTCPIEEKK